MIQYHIRLLQFERPCCTSKRFARLKANANIQFLFLRKKKQPKETITCWGTYLDIINSLSLLCNTMSTNYEVGELFLSFVAAHLRLPVRDCAYCNLINVL